MTHQNLQFDGCPLNNEQKTNKMAVTYYISKSCSMYVMTDVEVYVC